ncbi:IS1096 element passenger TnpR family protein, partial [Mesorhizobium sp. ArgA1]
MFSCACASAFDTSQRIRYEYDFGDLWEHGIRVEAKLEREAGKVYPICIAGARAG